MRGRSVLALLSAAVLALLLGGCSLLGGDIRERLDLFMTTLNAADRSTINSQFDQARTTDLPTMDATWWSTNFPAPPDADHPYALTVFDFADPSKVTGILMGPPAFNSNTGVPRNIVLTMSRVGSDWFIEKIYLDGSATPLIQ
jgi:hypothetical protein